MPWFAWFGIGWMIASVVIAVGWSRWQRFLRGDFDAEIARRRKRRDDEIDRRWGRLKSS